MSGPSRLDRLESEIVAALRDAPGPSPSSELDARILARAHAGVAAPKRRPQPRWFSMAAGLVVLVGSGLALRIWQQVEHAPSALDAPVAPAAPAAAAGPPMDDESAAVTITGSAVARESTPSDTVADAPESARKDTAKREAIPEPAPRREIAPAKPTATAANAPSSSEPAADGFSQPAQQALAKSRPFPDEVNASGESASTSAALPATLPAPVTPAPAAMAAPEVMAAPAAAPPPPAPEAPSTQMLAEPVLEMAPAPPAEPANRAEAAAAGEIARQLGAEAALPASGSSALADGMDAATSERDRSAASEDQRGDPFDDGVASVRGALAAGDTMLARRLLQRLQHDFPTRELPKDLREFADRRP